MDPIIIQPDRRLRAKMFLTWLLAVITGGLLTIFFGYLIGSDDGGASGAVTGMLIAAGITALWAVPWLIVIVPYYNSLEYEIQDDEVIVRVGVVTKSVKHVPYRTVTNIETTRDPFDRLFGIGTLKIQTAGAGGQSGAEETLPGLRDYEGLYEKVAAILRRFRGGIAPTQAGEDPEPVYDPPVDRDTMAAILAEVRAIRQALER